jgi:hypothetical protein
MSAVEKKIGTFKKLTGASVDVGSSRDSKDKTKPAVSVAISMGFGTTIKRFISPDAAREFAALLVVAADEAEKA